VHNIDTYPAQKGLDFMILTLCSWFG